MKKKISTSKILRRNARLVSLVMALVALITCVSVTFAWFGSTYENLNTVINMGDFKTDISVYSADGELVTYKSAENGDNVDFDNSSMMSGWASGDVSCYYIYALNTGDIDVKTYFSLASDFYGANASANLSNMTEHFKYYLVDITKDANRANGFKNYIADDEMPSAEFIKINGESFKASSQEDGTVIEAGKNAAYALYFCCYDLPDEYIKSEYSFAFNTAIITTQADAPEATVSQEVKKVVNTQATEPKTEPSTETTQASSAASSASVTHTKPQTVVTDPVDVSKNEWEWKYNDATKKTVCLTAYNGSATEVTIPALADGALVTRLGNGLFKNSKVKTVVVPACVTSFEKDAFTSSTLKTLSFQSKTSVSGKVYTSPYTSDGKAVYKDNKQTLVRCLPQNIGKSFNVPKTVTAIYDYAFDGCKNLEKLSMYNVSAVSTLTFTNSAIKDYYLYSSSPVNVTGANVFGASGKVTVHVLEELKAEYADKTLTGSCTVKADIKTNIYENVAATEIGGIKYVIIDNNSEYNGVVYSYGTAKRIAVVSGYTSIPKDGTVVIPESIVCDNIKYNVAAIADNAFAKCDSLKQVVLPNNKVRYSSTSFEGCSKLELIKYSNAAADKEKVTETAAVKEESSTEVSDDTNITEPAE